jgi:hypothetical protein
MHHDTIQSREADLERFRVDEQEFYSPVSLAEECSGVPPGWVGPEVVLPLWFVGPPDFLFPQNQAHQRRNRVRDEDERFLNEWKALRATT